MPVYACKLVQQVIADIDDIEEQTDRISLVYLVDRIFENVSIRII